MEIMTEIRVIQNTPFCWQEKKILRLIRAHFDDSAIRIASAISLYVALTEAASNRSTDLFTTTIGELASLSGLARPTVMKLLKEFERIEILQVERKMIDNLNLPSDYTLLSGKASLPLVKRDDEKNYHYRRKEKKIEKKKKKKLIEYSDAFNRFWESYPKKRSKAVAWSSFDALDPSAELLEKMITTIEAFKGSEDWLKEEGRFIPLPSSWLNQERWHDELPEKPEPEEFENTYVPGRKFE
jgi:hypothetical protein